MEIYTVKAESPETLTHPDIQIQPPTLKFEHHGDTHTLAKHSTVQQAIKHGKMTLEQARWKPWYLRLKIGDKEQAFKFSNMDKDAVRAAKDLLNGQRDKPDLFSEFLSIKAAKRGLTIGALADEWIAAGLPESKTNPRDPAAAETLRQTIVRALVWWRAIPARAAAQHFEDFAASIIGHTRTGDGRRTVDLQLAALSCLCQWAVLCQKLETNPFAKRPKYVLDDKIEHCHRFMPDNDEQLHAILRHIWTSGDPQAIVAGAWLCFGALTGLRPHEPGFLQRVPAVNQFPAHLESQPNGLVFPMPDGSIRMKVQRGKGGQNPTITLHPLLTDFLRVWNTWLDTQPETFNPQRLLFPCPLDRLGDVLHAATRDLKLREMHPHGFMRAYYVRVQKSAGKDPAIVAAELGQTTGGALIRNVYGNPNDPFGGNLFDWQPNDLPVAWELLQPNEQTNIIAL